MSRLNQAIRVIDEYEQAPPFAARLLIIVALVAIVCLMMD